MKDSVFKQCLQKSVLQTLKNQALFGKGLNDTTLSATAINFEQEICEFLVTEYTPAISRCRFQK